MRFGWSSLVRPKSRVISEPGVAYPCAPTGFAAVLCFAVAVVIVPVSKEEEDDVWAVRFVLGGGY
jgi:hypothetical protein